MAFHSKRRPPGGKLGSGIRSIRKRLDLNQGEFADKLGWPRNTLVQYELHKIMPSTGRLFRLLQESTEEREKAPIVAALEAQGINLADLSAIAGSYTHSAQQGLEVQP